MQPAYAMTPLEGGLATCIYALDGEFGPRKTAAESAAYASLDQVVGEQNPPSELHRAGIPAEHFDEKTLRLLKAAQCTEDEGIANGEIPSYVFCRKGIVGRFLLHYEIPSEETLAQGSTKFREEVKITLNIERKGLQEHYAGNAAIPYLVRIGVDSDGMVHVDYNDLILDVPDPEDPLDTAAAELRERLREFGAGIEGKAADGLAEKIITFLRDNQ